MSNWDDTEHPDTAKVRQLRAALEACREHVRLNHKASAWWNDSAVWRLINDHIDPALGDKTR